MIERDDVELDDLAVELLERWRRGDHLSTLDLRGACHAAGREGAADEATLSREIADREAIDR